MKPFSYHQPQNLQEASRLLGDDWQASLLNAGGTDILGMMKHHIEEPAHLVNLKSIEGLDSIAYYGGKGLSIGAMVTISDIASNAVINEKYPVLAQAAHETASPQLRNQGTIGGNLCQRPRCWYFRGDFDCLRKGGDLCYAADGQNKYHCIVGGGPCFIVHPSDLAVALLALDARVAITSESGSREAALNDFFVLPEEDILRENILKPNEIVTEIHVPELPADTRSAYIKFKERDAWDFAVVSVAARIRKRGNRIVEGKTAFGGVAPKPWEESTINETLNGLTIDGGAIERLAGSAFQDALPLAQNGYKVPLARNLLKRILRQLTAA